MMLTTLSFTCLVLAAVPAGLFVVNLRLYQRPCRATRPAGQPSVSVLIPARNEESSIGRAVEAALASVEVDLEVIVLDDQSSDATAPIVRTLAVRDARVVLHLAPALPEGWCGKQHACAVLARLATRPILAFLDADVRLAPDGLARAVSFLEDSGADLVSGIPRQKTGGLLEAMVIPLIHFVLLGFLPLGRMRRKTGPAYAAGCGQMFVTRKNSYERMGGHAAIRASLHDGIMLPRAYRAAGLSTDLFDATDVAECRMYHSTGALWRGLSKNATEGLASAALIGPATVVLLGGQFLPIVLTAMAPALGLSRAAMAGAAAGSILVYLPRLLGVARFRQPWRGVVLHPVGVLVLLAIQWWGLGRALLGRPVTWKNRSYHAIEPGVLASERGSRPPDLASCRDQWTRPSPVVTALDAEVGPG